MHCPSCGSPGTTLALSALDQRGASQLCGAPAHEHLAHDDDINAPMSGATVPQSFTVSAAAVIVDTDLVRAEPRVDGATCRPGQAGPFDFLVSTSPWKAGTTSRSAARAPPGPDVRSRRVAIRRRRRRRGLGGGPQAPRPA